MAFQRPRPPRSRTAPTTTTEISKCPTCQAPLSTSTHHTHLSLVESLEVAANEQLTLAASLNAAHESLRSLTTQRDAAYSELEALQRGFAAQQKLAADARSALLSTRRTATRQARELEAELEDAKKVAEADMEKKDGQIGVLKSRMGGIMLKLQDRQKEVDSLRAAVSMLELRVVIEREQGRQSDKSQLASHEMSVEYAHGDEDADLYANQTKEVQGWQSQQVTLDSEARNENMADTMPSPLQDQGGMNTHTMEEAEKDSNPRANVEADIEGSPHGNTMSKSLFEEMRNLSPLVSPWHATNATWSPFSAIASSATPFCVAKSPVRAASSSTSPFRAAKSPAFSDTSKINVQIPVQARWQEEQAQSGSQQQRHSSHSPPWLPPPDSSLPYHSPRHITQPLPTSEKLLAFDVTRVDLARHNSDFSQDVNKDEVKEGRCVPKRDRRNKNPSPVPSPVSRISSTTESQGWLPQPTLLKSQMGVMPAQARSITTFSPLAAQDASPKTKLLGDSSISSLVQGTAASSLTIIAQDASLPTNTPSPRSHTSRAPVQICSSPQRAQTPRSTMTPSPRSLQDLPPTTSTRSPRSHSLPTLRLLSSRQPARPQARRRDPSTPPTQLTSIPPRALLPHTLQHNTLPTHSLPPATPTKLQKQTATHGKTTAPNGQPRTPTEADDDDPGAAHLHSKLRATAEVEHETSEKERLLDLAAVGLRHAEAMLNAIRVARTSEGYRGDGSGERKDRRWGV